MTRIYCDECGEELWGREDGWGTCAHCLRKQRECEVCGDHGCESNHTEDDDG
jgi:hypothetical protein